LSNRGVHEAAAAESIALLPTVASHPGWRVTVLYYAAIQKLEAKLADRREHPDNHSDRRTACLSISPAVAVPWRSLKQLSEDWRYQGTNPNAVEVAKAERWASDMAAAMGESWP
jgi:hypothetical protein